jgi:hypothetical protein
VAATAVVNGLDAAKKVYTTSNSALARRKSTGNIYATSPEKKSAGGGLVAGVTSRITSRENILQPRITYSKEYQEVDDIEERMILERKESELPKSRLTQLSRTNDDC